MDVRPFVLLSCAISADGYLDDTTPTRLILSSEADADRVDETRAGVDAILVGAATVRRDNPRLLVRSQERRRRRVARGSPPSPAKVTLTASGDLDPAANFFTAGDGEKLVYCSTAVTAATRARLGGVAAVIDGGDPLVLSTVLSDLGRRGVRRLMVEGGARVLTQFMSEALADELQLVVAPLLVGDPAAPRFGGTARFPSAPGGRMTLAETRRLGDVVLLRYLLTTAADDMRWLRQAIELSRRCPPSPRAYSVGAMIIDSSGEVMATGYSREGDSHDHAEEAALRKAYGDAATKRRLAGATLYSSLEPCSSRASRSQTCTELILQSGVGRVVFAWREPSLFADCQGAEILGSAGIRLTEMPELAGEARAVNAHLFGPESGPAEQRDAARP